MFGTLDIGIDLGTASVLIYVKGRGVVLREPSVVAINRDTGELMAVGEEARRMLGRTPGNIVAERPLRDGVVSDYETTERMLRYFIQKVCGKRLLFGKPRAMICVPSVVTEVERRSVLDAARAVGVRAELIEETIAAAIGAGLDIARPNGCMVVDIGGGTTDVAVISMGGTVTCESIRVAGDKFDEAIIRYMRKKHNLLIGERTAEEIKVTIGSAYPRREVATMEVVGRCLAVGLPRMVTVGSDEMIEALEEPVQEVINAVHAVLERTPPELLADIAERGIVMTGGGALLYGLDRLIQDHTKIPCYVADDAVSSVVLGTGLALENMRMLLKRRPRE